MAAKKLKGRVISVKKAGFCESCGSNPNDPHGPDCPVGKRTQVICANCSQGQHSSKGAPEYGSSLVCPDKRCQCICRGAHPKSMSLLIDEIRRLETMAAGATYETKAELSCAIDSLKWAVGLKKKPLSTTYGYD